MVKKFLFNPFTGLAAIAAAQLAYVRFAVPPPTSLGTLGALSFSGIVAFVVCNIVTSFTFRPNGAGGGTRVLARFVAALGGTIIGFTAAAYAFGTSAALLYAGMGIIALVAAAAMRALS